MYYNHQKRGHIHRFACTNCASTVVVDFGKVKDGFVARCKKCGAEYPFNKSDERLIRSQKRHIK